MITLGIETSCDDTSLAIVKNGRDVLRHVTASQIEMHNKTGGIVPEVAAREHIRMILPVYKEVLKQAKISINEIDSIAVTRGPGLVSSLLIGDLLASTLGLIAQKPIFPIQHIEGHIYSNWLERDPHDFQFPILILTASGGHNDLILMSDHGVYKKIGQTRDDAAGEAFDKVARILGLPYPGGPSISKAALHGDPTSVPLPRPLLHNTFDFSFSGLKSEALRIVEKTIKKQQLSLSFIANFSASFQQCIVDVLSTKLLDAAHHFHVSEIHIAGGVSANKLLRETVETKGKQANLNVKFPKQFWYSTDNGAMIATCAFFHAQHKKQNTTWHNILPDPNLSFL